MIKSSQFSPALKGGVSPLPVPASGRGDLLAEFEAFLLRRCSDVLDELEKLAADPLVVAQGREFLSVCHQHDDLLTALDLVRAFRDRRCERFCKVAA